MCNLLQKAKYQSGRAAHLSAQHWGERKNLSVWPRANETAEHMSEDVCLQAWPTWVQSTEPIWWKERTNYSKLSLVSPYTLVEMHTLASARTHQLKCHNFKKRAWVGLSYKKGGPGRERENRNKEFSRASPQAENKSQRCEHTPSATLAVLFTAPQIWTDCPNSHFISSLQNHLQAAFAVLHLLSFHNETAHASRSSSYIRKHEILLSFQVWPLSCQRIQQSHYAWHSRGLSEENTCFVRISDDVHPHLYLPGDPLQKAVFSTED